MFLPRFWDHKALTYAFPAHLDLESKALHRAAFFGWCPILRLLLEFGADPELADLDGKLPRHLAKPPGVKTHATQSVAPWKPPKSSKNHPK